MFFIRIKVQMSSCNIAHLSALVKKFNFSNYILAKDLHLKNNKLKVIKQGLISYNYCTIKPTTIG